MQLSLERNSSISCSLRALWIPGAQLYLHSRPQVEDFNQAASESAAKNSSKSVALTS